MDSNAGAELRTVALRSTSRGIAALEAKRLRMIDALASAAAREADRWLARTPDGTWQPTRTQLAMSAVTAELMIALGIGKAEAERLELLADRLVRVLPDTLTALEEGRVDLTRARVLAESTRILGDAGARTVEALLLPDAGQSPWDGPSPRAWKARVERAVVTVDADAARRRREQAVTERLVRAWAEGDGVGVLQVTAAHEDIAVADQVVTDLANAWPTVGADGRVLSMDQRRVDALMDLFRRSLPAPICPPFEFGGSARSRWCCTPTPSSATARRREIPDSSRDSAPRPLLTRGRQPRPAVP